MFRRTELMQHGILGTLVLTMLFSFDFLPSTLLGECALALALWAALTTFLVAALGAWVALRRQHRRPLERPLA